MAQTTTNLSDATIDDLVDKVVQYIETNFYSSPSTQLDIDIKSIARAAINSYVNSTKL